MTASCHADLPGRQGNAYADGATGSGQQTATGHAESGHGVTGIEKRAKRTMTGVDALDLLTANGKRSESENYDDVHESYSFVTWPSYPSLFHDPKIGNHGRITRGGKTPKSPSNSHVLERAVRIGERHRSQRRGKWESTASGQLPGSPQRAGSSHFARSRRRRRSGSAQPRGTSNPPARPRSSGRGGSPPRQNTRCTLRPLLPPLPSEGEGRRRRRSPRTRNSHRSFCAWGSRRRSRNRA